MRDPTNPEHVRDALTHPDPVTSEWALAVLSRRPFDLPWDELVGFLARGQDDGNAYWDALHALAHGGDDAATVLVGAWDTVHPDARADALRLLRQHRVDGVADLARRLRRDDDVEVARLATSILARVGADADVEALLEEARSGKLSPFEVSDAFVGGHPALLQYLAARLLDDPEGYGWAVDRYFFVEDEGWAGPEERLALAFPEGGRTAREGRAEVGLEALEEAWRQGPASVAAWWRGRRDDLDPAVAAHGVPTVRQEGEALLEALLDEAVRRGAWPEDPGVLAGCVAMASREREYLAWAGAELRRLRDGGPEVVSASVEAAATRVRRIVEHALEDVDEAWAHWAALACLAAEEPDRLAPHVDRVAEAYALVTAADEIVAEDELVDILVALGDVSAPALLARRELSPRGRWRVLGRIGTPAALDAVLPRPDESMSADDVRAVRASCRPERFEALALWQAVHDDPFGGLALAFLQLGSEGRLDERGRAWFESFERGATRPARAAAPARRNRGPGKAERRKRQQHRRASQRAAKKPKKKKKKKR